MTRAAARGGVASRCRVALAALLLALAAPGTAIAAEGDPHLDACLTLVTTPPCVAGSGPARPAAMALAPNGRWLYVATSAPSGIQLYDRDPVSGALSRRAGSAGCITSDGSGGCTTVSRYVGETGEVVIDPTGRHLYATLDSGRLLVFDVDPATGALAPRAGTAGCLSTAPAPADCTLLRGGALLFAAQLDPVSATTLYVRASGSLLVLDRSATTGALVQKAGAAGCLVAVPAAGCGGAAGIGGEGFQLAVSSDGGNVYTTTNDTGGVAVFKRDPTGALAQASGPAGGCITHDGTSGGVAGSCVDGSAALGNAWAVVLDSKGESAYVSGQGGTVAYRRDPATGLLSEVACYFEVVRAGCPQRRGASAWSTAITPDGTGFVGSVPLSMRTLGFLVRDPATGELAQRPGANGCFSGDGSGGACQPLPALGGEGEVLIAPDGLDVYVTARQSGMIATFSRDVAPQCTPRPPAIPAVISGLPLVVPLGCTDANGDAVVYEIVAPPSHGSLSPVDQAAGTVTYTSAAGYLGADRFEFRAIARGVATPPVVQHVAVIGADPPPAPPPGGGGGRARRPVVAGRVGARWRVRGDGTTSVRRLGVARLPASARVVLTCRGRGCPLSRKGAKVRRGRARLAGLLGDARLRPRARVAVRITAAGLRGKVVRFTVRRGKQPTRTTLCLPPGGGRAQRC